MQVIAIVGSKKSGKTTTTENLIREFSERGYKVAAIKHISDPDFTIDTPGKDTWKFAKAGAKTVISVAANEITTIEKVPPKSITLKILLEKCKGKDIVFIEGFKRFVGLEADIPKIVVVKSRKEFEKAQGSFIPILAFSGPYITEADTPMVPYVDGLKRPKELANFVEKFISKK